MQLKLKENPREWQKLVLTGVVVLGGVSWWLWRRGSMAGNAFGAIVFLLSGTLLLCWLRPRLFRPVYRGVMTASFYVGQGMGRVLLAIFFVMVLSPLALMLRLLGKDLLRLKRDAQAETYWRPAKISQDFDRQF
jgi:hypothetical protein